MIVAAVFNEINKETVLEIYIHPIYNIGRLKCIQKSRETHLNK